MTRTSVPIRLALVAAAATALGSVAAPAHAADGVRVERSGATLVVTGTSVNNQMNVLAGFGVVNIDDRSGVLAGTGCVRTGQNSAQCSTAGISEIKVSSGAGNDFVFTKTGIFTTVIASTGDDILQNAGSGQARLNGNDGNDQIFGNTVDKLFGQNGNDFLSGGLFLRGGAGNDTLRGLDGNDTMFGDEGHDNLDGGPGFDDLCATAEVTANCEAF